MLQRAREHRLQFHSGNINTSGYTDLGEVPNWLLQTKPKTCESQSQTNKKKIVSGENEDTGSLDDAQEEKKHLILTQMVEDEVSEMLSLVFLLLGNIYVKIGLLNWLLCVSLENLS